MSLCKQCLEVTHSRNLLSMHLKEVKHANKLRLLLNYNRIISTIIIDYYNSVKCSL